MNLNLSVSYGKVYSVSPYDWKTTPTGRVLRNNGEVANLLSSSSGASILYMPGYFSPTDISRTSVGVKLTHAISPQLFYDFKLQFKSSKYNTYKTKNRDLAPVFEPVPGYFVDEAPYGYYGLAVSGVDGTSLGGWMNLGRDKSRNNTYSFEFDITSQINPYNQLKAGVRFIYNDFDIISTTENPKDTWTRSMIYRVFPLRIGVYVQDKLEFEGFIANVGLRLDYSDSNTKNYLLQQYDQHFKPGYGNVLEEKVDFEDSKADWSLSPRLGISHPITEESKLYFNYNHFHSVPASAYRFRLQRENDGLVTHMGNPNLEMEKTISYELGYEHNLFAEYLLKVAAYYKNVSNQPSSVYYRGLSPTVQVYRYENTNYEDIRGFELTLYKRVGTWVRGFINYTYDVRTYGYFGYREYWEDPTEMKRYIKRTPTLERLRPRPYARANINIQTPSEFGPEWVGIKPFGDWYLNLLADWKTGEYYIWQLSEDIERELQWRDWYNVDLRLTKSIQLSSSISVQVYMDITNVFNFKHLDRSGSTGAGFSDNYDWENYLESLHFPWESGDQNGNDKIGDYRPPGVAFDRMEPNLDNDPEIAARNEERKKNKSYIDMPNITSFTFLNPRNILFGIRLNF
jgi:outer membrane receptor protein involved in Fe transport